MEHTNLFMHLVVLHIVSSGINQLRPCLDIKYFSEFHMVSKIGLLLSVHNF
jgi:hypothetical protein